MTAGYNSPCTSPSGLARYKTLPAGRKISRTKTHPHCTERSFLPPSSLPHRAAHSGRQCCLKEPRGERKTTPARGSGTPDETFSTPARHGSGHHELFIAHTHPKCPISNHFQRAGAIFLSHRHPTRPHGATQGRYFFHATPREHPRRGGHRRNQAHLETQSLTAVLVGGGGAWPDNEPTHRAHISDQAPLVWRVPEGPEGTGGLRDRPLRAQLACGDLAGGRARRRPEHQRRRKQQAQSRIPGAVLVGDGGARPDNEPTHRAHISDKAPLVWRAPEGPEGARGPGRGAGGWRQGQGGPRDRPLRAVRLACGDLAGGPPPTGTHSGRAPQSSPAQQVRPSGARNTSGATSTAENQAISGSRAPSGSPTRRQHPSARAGAPNRR